MMFYCDFIQKALNGEALTIHGDGSQKRSFCYISDMIEGLYQLMNKNYKYLNKSRMMRIRY